MSVSSLKVIEAAPLVASAPDQVFVDALVLQASVGIFEHEYEARQPVEISLLLDTRPAAEDYSTANILRYDHIVADIETLTADTHFDLVETLGEAIAQIVFAYPSVIHARITVAKLDAITAARAVGITLNRRRAG